MAGLPVTIRLLDPPLHEFLPTYTEVEVASEEMRLTEAPAKAIAAQEALVATVESLHEANPMLGTRGCRLGLQWPEIYEMQVRAIVGQRPLSWPPRESRRSSRSCTRWSASERSSRACARSPWTGRAPCVRRSASVEYRWAR